MTFHIEEGPDLAEGQILTVPQGHHLVEGAHELIGISENLSLVQALASAGHNLRKQVERINVLKNVRLAVGDEHHVKLV